MELNRPERESHPPTPENIGKLVGFAQHIEHTHHSCILPVSYESDRYRFMRFFEHGNMPLSLQHIEEIDRREFLIRHMLVDAHHECLLHSQFIDINAIFTDAGTPEPSEAATIQHLFEFTALDDSLVGGNSRGDMRTALNLDPYQVYKPVDERSFSRIYSDIEWLHERIYLH